MTKTIKKLWAGLLLGVVVAVPLLNLAPQKASAYALPSSDNQAHLTVHLSGTTGAQGSYVVKAVRQANLSGATNTISFTYMASGIQGDSSALFYSDPINAAGAPQCTAASNINTIKTLTFNINVTLNGKSVAPTATWSFCNTGKANTGGGNGTISGPINIAVVSSSTSLSSVSGKFTNTDNTGTVHPFVGSKTQATMTQNFGSHTVYTLKVGSDGTFTQTNILPGDYTFSASTTSTTGGSVFGPVTETIKPGANDLGSLDASTPPTPSGGGSTDCNSSTDAQGNTTACADATLDCGGGALNWIVCPVITLAQGAANKLDSFITNTLDLDVKPIFDTSTTSGQGYYKAWNSFRVLATALLVIGGLVMVASQALGFEFLDAYTIRKTLPRLLIAVIGISLAWPLMKLAVNFFDTLGFDVRALMYAPFKAFNGQISIATGVLTTLGVGAALLVLGPVSLTFILTALLAVFVGFIILVIRQIAIVMLIILSPIAIACYILPNTQKVWKLWSENFLGLLLMFPIISALIATGHIFSAVTLQGGGANDTHSVVAQAIGLVAYFVPYFLLPLAARLATGAIGNLAGVVNDRGKGAFDRLKKARGNAAVKNLGRMKAGNRFSERNALTRGFNRTSAGAGSGWNGRFGLGERGAQAIHQARHTAALNDVMKSPAWATIQENDGALRAATYQSAAAARAAGVGEDSIAAVQASIGFGSPQAMAAAQQLATTGTGYKNLADQAMTIARASGGDKNTAAAIAGYNNFINKQKGRHDLAPGAGNLINLSNAAMTQSESATQAQAAQLNEAAWNSGSLYQHANGKKQALENLTGHFTQQYKEALAMPAGAERDAKLRKALTVRNELQAMLPQASGDNQQVINNALGVFQQHESQQGFTGTMVGPQTVEQAAHENRYREIEREAKNSARGFERPDPDRLAQNS